MWNLSYYTSPLIITFLYRRGYFVAESITSFAKVSTGIGLIVMISLCMRSFGRSQTRAYTKFVEALNEAKADPKAKEKLRVFDFDFKDWPVDFDVKEVDGLVRPGVSFYPFRALSSILRIQFSVIYPNAKMLSSKPVGRNHSGSQHCHAKLPRTLRFIHSEFA